jgi:general secretion pathway protein D
MKVILFLLPLLASCALQPTAVDEARKRLHEGRGEEALAILDRAAKEQPDDLLVRGEYFRMREMVSAQWLAQAESLRAAGELDAAEALYRRVLQHNSANARANAGVQNLDMDRRHRASTAAAEKLVRAERYLEAEDLLRPVLAENPQNRDARRLQRVVEERTAKPAVTAVRLRPPEKPISVDVRDIPLRGVFDVLQRLTTVNFIFDRDVRTDQRTSITVKDTTLDEVLRVVLLANQLEQKVLNERTVFIYPNTPQKLREHQELVVKAFYIANADVKQTANMIRTMVKTRDVFVDEKISLLVLKDTPSAIALAERLIAAQDLAEPEVMLEVEVLEVGRNRLLEIGLRHPDSVALSLVGAAGTPGTVTLPEWLNSSSDIVRLSFTNPLFLLQLRQQDDSTTVLANPRIRVKNKEKARIHIGDRVPVITTTAAATGGFVSESVSYQEVGLKFGVEPLVYLEDEVGMKVELEVSNIAREVRGVSSNTLTYQIGTRNANTTLRLRDGETQVLAGLINDEDRRTANRVPGLGELPVLGRLFSHTRDSRGRTEIVLLITPRVVRGLARPDARSIEFAAGTEAAAGGRPTAVPTTIPPIPSVLPPQQPAAEPAPGTVPAVPVVPMVPFGGPRPAPQ